MNRTKGKKDDAEKFVFLMPNFFMPDNTDDSLHCQIKRETETKNEEITDNIFGQKKVALL